jgi:hypothetical protein
MRGIFVGCRWWSRAHLEHRRRYHGAAMGIEAMRFLIVWMAGWINSRQLEVIDFLREENRVLREQACAERFVLSIQI